MGCRDDVGGVDDRARAKVWEKARNSIKKIINIAFNCTGKLGNERDCKKMFLKLAKMVESDIQ